VGVLVGSIWENPEPSHIKLPLPEKWFGAPCNSGSWPFLTSLPVCSVHTHRHTDDICSGRRGIYACSACDAAQWSMWYVLAGWCRRRWWVHGVSVHVWRWNVHRRHTSMWPALSLSRRIRRIRLQYEHSHFSSRALETAACFVTFVICIIKSRCRLCISCLMSIFRLV